MLSFLCAVVWCPTGKCESLPKKLGSLEKPKGKMSLEIVFSSCPCVIMPAISTSFRGLGSLRHAEMQSLDLSGLCQMLSATQKATVEDHMFHPLNRYTFASAQKMIPLF